MASQNGEAQTTASSFEAIFNFRDLGGYPASRGRTTKGGVLFRSASLNEATRSDMDVLANGLGVRTDRKSVV